MNTWETNNYVGFDGSILILGIGGGFGKPAAMDEFWIAFAGIDKEKKDAGAIIVTSALYNVYIDYLAQDKLEKIGNDLVCNHYGLTGKECKMCPAILSN